MPRARIDDVARMAGVSKTTVSFAFNQPDAVKQETRERVLRAATDLGYRPSPIARRLTARRTGQLGLVIPQRVHEVFVNPFISELVSGIGEACDDEGMSLVIVPPRQGSLARAVNDALVDGLILLGLNPGHPDLTEVRRTGLPVVALDVEGWDDVDIVSIDDTGGAQQAAAHLYGLGHRHIAVLLIGPYADTPGSARRGISARRLAGIRAGFRLAPDQDAGEESSLQISTAAVSPQGGRAAFTHLQTAGLPTAVMTMSDITAIGLMSAATAAGLRIPADMSVTGFDDVPAAAWTTPGLTTVRQPIREKGRAAAQRLIEVLGAGDGSQPTTLRLGTELVIRGSTGSPPS